MNILINFPTNIGDVILALPVLDTLRTNYPSDSITAIASSKTKDLLKRNDLINEVILFDKSWGPFEKLRFCLRRRGHYQTMIDLKNSFLPLLLGVRKHTSFIRTFSNKIHIEDKYMYLIKKIAPRKANLRSDFTLSQEEKAQWDALPIRDAIILACTSRTRIKRYPSELIRQVVRLLGGCYPILVLGEQKEEAFYADILNEPQVHNLLGKTTLWDVFYILKKYARLVVGVDSSLTHMASYLNIPVVALFGPTSYERSYPRSPHSIVLRKSELACLPCESARCRRNNECMSIEPQKVIEAITRIIKEQTS